MSKLEVDTIDTTSGGSGTLTIGSDQNAALKVKREATTTVTGDGSTTTSASAGDILLVDVSSATATIQLPASPNVGDVVAITDISNSAGTNNITIDRNSENIEGEASNLTFFPLFTKIGMAGLDVQFGGGLGLGGPTFEEETTVL